MRAREDWRDERDGRVIWFIWSIWFSQTNETDQINKSDQPVLCFTRYGLWPDENSPGVTEKSSSPWLHSVGSRPIRVAWRAHP